jgi:hypothetical protein
MNELHSADRVMQSYKFSELLKSSHLKRDRSNDKPKCLGSDQSEEWLSYDAQCSYSLTPSEYCCQVYAEQACADPRMSSSQASSIVNERTSGLGGAASPFLYDRCMIDNCSFHCSLTDGDDESCRFCSNICQRSCLVNLVHVCMKRTCGQTIISLSEKAISHQVNSPEYALHEKTEQEVRKKLHISKADLRQIESSQIVNYALGLMEPGASVPLCTDSQLQNSDESAKVVVNSSGLTFIQALVACTRDVLNSDKLGAILNDPSILERSQECAVAASCERNHIKLATDRAVHQIENLHARRERLAHGSY